MKGELQIPFGRLIQAAMRGDHDFAQRNLTPHLTRQGVHWAIETGLDADEDIRNLAAIVLSRCAFGHSLNYVRVIKAKLETESCLVIRYRLAIALWQRGERRAPVRQQVLAAMEDSNVGRLAREVFWLQ